MTDSATEKYVLVHTDDDGRRSFFKNQNLYLGFAETTTVLENATFLDLREAEAKFSCMNEKKPWSIWSVKVGVVLDKKSERHLIREEREQLLARLKELPADEGAERKDNDA
jgi:hypothetical protein